MQQRVDFKWIKPLNGYECMRCGSYAHVMNFSDGPVCARCDDPENIDYGD